MYKPGKNTCEASINIIENKQWINRYEHMNYTNQGFNASINKT